MQKLSRSVGCFRILFGNLFMIFAGQSDGEPRVGWAAEWFGFRHLILGQSLITDASHQKGWITQQALPKVST